MFSEQFDLSWGRRRLWQNVTYEVRPREPGSHTGGLTTYGKYQTSGSVVLGSSTDYATGPRPLFLCVSLASSEMGMIATLVSATHSGGADGARGLLDVGQRVGEDSPSQKGQGSVPPLPWG